MAFPAEEGLIRQYTVSFQENTEPNSPQTVYFTADGSESSLDYSSEMIDQGACVFVQNPSTETSLIVKAWTTMKFYGNFYPVLLGTFYVEPESDAAFGIGYGLIRRYFRIEVTNDGEITQATNVVVAIVPANG